MEGFAVSALFDSLKAQISDVDSPIQRFARSLQEGITAGTSPSERDGTAATTEPGKLATGDAPTAAQVRGADLQVPGKVDEARACLAEALADGGLDRLTARVFDDGGQLSLRWILCHMIEEYARHNGHADLLRESIDGVTGE